MAVSIKTYFSTANSVNSATSCRQGYLRRPGVMVVRMGVLGRWGEMGINTACLYHKLLSFSVVFVVSAGKLGTNPATVKLQKNLKSITR